MAKGTETLSAGLTNLSTKILEAVADALLMKSVVGPISNALSGGLGSLFPTRFPARMGNIFDHGWARAVRPAVVRARHYFRSPAVPA